MDSSDKTQLHRWFGLTSVPKCLGAEMSCSRSVRLPRLLLSCDARPRMKAVYWLSLGCRVFVEAFLCVRHLVVGHWLAVFLTGALGQDLAGRRGGLFTGIIISISRKGVATQNGCLCREIGVFSHMSCEVDLFYDHSGVKPTFWVFHSSIEYFESGCDRLLTVLDCRQVEYWRSILYSGL